MKRFVFLCLLLLPFAAFAQETPKTQSADENAVVITRLETRVHFENDGTGYRENLLVARINSEAGVQSYGQLAFGYSSATEKLEVDYVRVRKPNGQVVETPASASQDFAPLAMQSAPMYDDYRERHISVVSLRPGDTLEYKITTRIVMALAPGQFWYEYSFPERRRIEHASFTLETPKARELKLKSPKRTYTTSDAGDTRIYKWVVDDIRPDSKAAENDDQDDLDDIQLTTFTDWKQVAHWYSELQGKQVVVDDAVRKKAAELTAGAATPEEKARRLYEFVAREFRYVSLSFGVGRYQPHLSTEVLSTSYGDCKDKHTLFSALLKAAGIQSYPVLFGVGRRLDPDVPSPAQFNHVFTALKLGDKLTYADTTTEVAPFGLLLYSERDRQAVLATDDAPGGLARLPATVAVKNTMRYSVNGKVSEAGDLDATVELIATGDSAVSVREAFRSLSQSDWKKLVKMFVFADEKADVTDVSADGLEELSKPMHVHYRIRQDAYFTSATANYFPFLPLQYGPLPKKTRGNEPLRVGEAIDVTHSAHLEFPRNFSLRVPSDITVKREFGSFQATFKTMNNVLEAERRLIITVESVPLLRRAEIETLQTTASNTAAQMISLTMTAGAVSARPALAVATNANIEEVHRAATKALQQQDFKTASDLLQRVVAQQPKSEDAWDELGRAYRGLGDGNQAVTAFRKQLEIAPSHKRAYTDLGAALLEAGNNDEAVAAYRKQLDREPLDNYARKQLAMALFRLKRDKDAQAELEVLTGGPSTDPQAQLMLAAIYARNGGAAKASPIYQQVLGVTPEQGPELTTASLRDAPTPAGGNDARGVLSDISDQFDSGSYSENVTDATAIMPLVALEWARVGSAEAANGNALEALRFLTSAWKLDPASAIAARLASVHQKAGHASEARHFFALAAAADNSSAADAKAQLGSNADDAIARARGELHAMTEFHFANKAKAEGKATVALVFDGSATPARIIYERGNLERGAFDPAINSLQYPFSFPDNSSIKIVRQANVACSGTECSLSFEPLGSVLP